MRRLKRLILIFILALSVPLAYFILHTYRSLEQEETDQLRYFAEALFDEMEQELAEMVRTEESRAIDEYSYDYTPSGSGQKVRSPLSYPPRQPYILGYFQNNPDGSFQAPLLKEGTAVPTDREIVIAQFREINQIFNRKRITAREVFESQPMPPVARKGESPPSFAERYLKRTPSLEKKAYLGTKQKRLEQLTATQALNLARRDQEMIPQKEVRATQKKTKKAPVFSYESDKIAAEKSAETSWDSDAVISDDMAESEAADESVARQALILPSETLQAEVDPMQSVFIDDDRVFIFRRIAVRNRIFRQGFVIRTSDFLNHLAGAHFSPQPMSEFTHLTLNVVDRGRPTTSVHTGADADSPRFSLNRAFPRPFSFLRATLTCRQIPRSGGRQTLNVMIGVLVGIVLIGFFAIYRSTQVVMEHSHRRTQFVSSVTHELKTPLTNIRMYIEMLEQGIARTPEREQDYFRILGSESARLSRLINNILEFSKLEKKQLYFNWQTGTPEAVIAEVREVIGETLRQQGFTLKVANAPVPPVRYDREVMVQVLINLIENSVKFGKNGDRKEITVRVCADKKQVHLSVSDTGPGIPRHALKKVFDDFYRVENALRQTTRGTGIGLAFVRKVITAMGGQVAASNNDGPGCTLTLSLPFAPDDKAADLSTVKL